MRILFLYPYPPGEAASQRFRFEQYFSLLDKEGIQYDGQSFWDIKTWRVLYKRGRIVTKVLGFLKGIARRVKIVFRSHQYDFIFVHRECAPLGPPVFEWVIAKLQRKKVIYDFDDAIWLPNTSKENNLISILKWPWKVQRICQWSHAVSCGNSFLADYAGKFNARVVLNPTTVETDHLHNPNLFQLKTLATLTTIGWTGTHSTLPHLYTLYPIFTILQRKFPGQWKLMVIADKAPELELPALEFRHWSKKTEIEDLLEFDIGVMPLPDNPWTNGKCGFKALQYMSLGIPSLASPVGVNKHIIDQGRNGYLCTSPVEWEEYLEALLFNPEQRKRIGTAGRQTVVDQFSVRSNSRTFLGLFS
jgi:glycosyltransferase involved in cell wall biosynthesis